MRTPEAGTSPRAPIRQDRHAPRSEIKEHRQDAFGGKVIGNL
jgi:hypothetical protein